MTLLLGNYYCGAKNDGWSNFAKSPKHYIFIPHVCLLNIYLIIFTIFMVVYGMEGKRFPIEMNWECWEFRPVGSKICTIEEAVRSTKKLVQPSIVFLRVLLFVHGFYRLSIEK